MSEDHNIIDYEEVLHVLPESFLQSWKDNSDVLIYLSELGALGLQRLSQEPERLAEEKIGILEQTQDLAFHNYKTFIQAAECSQKIFQDFNIIESRLDALLHKLPQFKNKCSEFGKEAHQINARWHQASSTLAKHPQLLEFLEMPQLMDNYVKGEYYDEALELSSYVKRLERKHVDIPLIKSIVKDVQIAANTMLAHLLGKLRTNIQLPECLKVVGYLRRMDVFNEMELRIKFLQARDSWFQKVINDIDKNDPYQHIIKVIESSRIHLFDIITQYRAIFSDEDPLLLLRENYKSNCAIFHSWITWKISWFLQLLEKDLSANLSGRIDSILAQCMYFGLSFSRVNIDFRPLLVPVFQNVVLHRYRSEVENATFMFEKLMDSYSFSSYTNTMLLVPSLPEDSMQPPNSLLDFYPLAHYCNDVLGSFNELRLCCSFSMCCTVTEILTKSLKRIVQTLINIHSKKR
ncbi:Conserved oligomeric Golgi complex subunit 8, partial [Stegodyphus mimosarum]